MQFLMCQDWTVAIVGVFLALSHTFLCKFKVQKYNARQFLKIIVLQTNAFCMDKDFYLPRKEKVHGKEEAAKPTKAAISI